MFVSGGDGSSFGVRDVGNPTSRMIDTNFAIIIVAGHSDAVTIATAFCVSSNSHWFDIMTACYRQGAAVMQGAFRSQNDDFLHGKLVYISKANMHGNTQLTVGNGIRIIAKGTKRYD